MKSVTVTVGVCSFGYVSTTRLCNIEQLEKSAVDERCPLRCPLSFSSHMLSLIYFITYVS